MLDEINERKVCCKGKKYTYGIFYGLQYFFNNNFNVNAALCSRREKHVDSSRVRH